MKRRNLHEKGIDLSFVSKSNSKILKDYNLKLFKNFVFYIEVFGVWMHFLLFIIKIENIKLLIWEEEA